MTVYRTGTEPEVLVRGTNCYELDADYVYEWAADGYNWTIVVPEGFVFDGASIPWITQFVIGKWDLGIGPPCVHDWIYKWKGNLPTGSFMRETDDNTHIVCEPWKRYEADRLFCRHMRAVGVPQWKRRMAYRAIRLGGWWAWNKSKDNGTIGG